MKAKFVLFVFLFCNAILFSATHLIPMYNIPSGDSNIFIDVSSYGDSDAEIRVAQGPSNFSINISDPTIPATSSGPVEKMISLQGVPASSFEDFAVFEIRNLYGEPHPRQFRVNFHYDMEISLDYSDVIYYYNSYFLSGETSECPCFNGIQRDYLSDVEGVEVFGNSGFYYTCENIDGNWKFVEYTDHYKLYHSLYCIGSFPFTANSNDRIGTVLLEILNASDIPVYSDLIDLSDQDLLNTSGSFSVDFSYIEGSDSNVFIEGTYQVQLTLTSRSGSSLKSEKKTIYIETSESYIETTAGNVPGTVISDDQQVIVMVPENSLEQPDLLTIDLIDSDTILSELSLEEISPASSVYDITLAQSALTGDASVTILYDDSELTLEEEFALVPLIWNADDLAWEDASSGFADVIKDVENNQIILISEHFSLYVIGLYPMDSQALHFTWISVENSYFSPNSDLIKDSLQVDVELNSPATVFYSVYDLSMSNIMASGQASYNDETPFSVFWNGKEENDQLLADGEYLLKVYASNGSETTSANIFKAIIDTGSPELYISGVENNGLYNNYVFPAISHKDENGSIVCVTDNGTEIFPDYSIGAPGAHTLNATVSDPAGNEASQTLNFTIDLAPPSVLLKVGDPFYFSLDLYISAMTLMGFEVSEGTALYSFDNANWISYSQDFVNGLPEGERRIYYYGTDLAGNRSTTKSYIFYNDYSPPESGIEFHNAYNNGTTQFAGEFSSISMSSYDVLSGLYAEYLKIDQDTYSEYQDSLDLAGLSEGNHTVSYYSEDNVVNIEDENIYSFMMDLTPPAISITATPSNLIAGQLVCYKNSVLEISGQDLLSGYSYAQYSISQDINEADFLNYTDPVVLSEYDYGEYYVKARGYDNIGNVSQIVDAILFIVPNVEVETDNCEPLNILVYSDADCSELEQVLIGSQEIWKVDIADTANIFDEKLRSGLFNGMVLLNGKNMKGTVSGKVSEYAYWGNPVINFGFTGLGDFFQELTGVKEFGKLEESIYSINVIPSAISPGFDYLFDGRPLELISFSSESSVAGTLEPGSSPAVIQNIHGRGRSLFFNHPIISLPSDLSDMIVSMLETYNFPEYDMSDNFPSRHIPVEYIVSNDSSETVSVKLDISSVDIAFLDISEGDIINNSTVQYFDLSPYSEKSISVMIQLPELKGDYTIERDLSLKCGGIYSLIDSTVDRYDISFTIDELYAAILLDLEEMSQVLSGNELSIVNEIYAEMEAMRENIGNFDSAMNNLLTQIKALRSIGSYDISEIRLKMDILIKYYGIKAGV